MKTLYPEIEPFDSGRLKVSDIHEIYYERVGNPDGIPVVFLHGGPGGGLIPMYRQFFDPQAYHVVLFDQRGSGKSTPHAELKENTTWDLINDIEALREKFGVEKWLVFGGSWGSTLSLAYAETHPDRVSGLILRGIFLTRKKELQWFYQSGASEIFPDFWERYRDEIPEEERGDFMTAYYKRLTGDDEQCSFRQPSVERLGRLDLETLSERGFDGALGRRARSPAISPHRMSLFYEQFVFPVGKLFNRKRREDSPHPDRHRPGSLRCRLPGNERLGFAQSVSQKPNLSLSRMQDIP
jgi:pimeloyl-ACP methyl ester carboxylesterase